MISIHKIDFELKKNHWRVVTQGFAGEKSHCSSLTFGVNWVIQISIMQQGAVDTTLDLKRKHYSEYSPIL